jgi:Asp-tRNA(Asn)/Glu-tRNA(Gln) amidotransferase A subunit family amidase
LPLRAKRSRPDSVRLQANELSAAEGARRIASGDLTSVALVTACLERIAAREAEVQAWAWLDPEWALAQARACDREAARSALHGVPVGIKDVIDVAGAPTECNSPILRGYRPRSDAACVAQLRRAGCVMLGKTSTAEFANAHPPATRNPHRPGHTPGGSSSGSAAAVADRMAPLALGTQTGGSIIRPASYCGVIGFKPTLHSINRAGLKFVAESLDTIGLFARHAEDIALALHILSGRAPAECAARGARAPRIGLFRTPRWHEADAAARASVEAAAAELAQRGARVSAFEAPGSFAVLDEAQVKIMNYETARALAWEHMEHAAQLSEPLRRRIEEGWALSREAYDAARQAACVGRRDMAERMRDFDFLLTPAAPGEAPATLSSTGSSVFNRVWTLLGLPCIALPSGAGASGLPLGVQLVGRRDEDLQLLAWADWAFPAR